MYSIYSDDIIIYHDISPLESVKLINPKLTLEDSAAGKLEFTLPPGNAGYNTITRLNSNIVVKKDNEEIWSGRVISESKDFYKRRKITCEGELSFLNDTTQPPHEYHTTLRGFIEALLNVHNEKVDESKKFILGAVTVEDDNDYVYRYTNSETTMKCFEDKLLSRLGGHLRIRKVNGVRYLDYLADLPSTSPQVIRFGSNLLDFAMNFDMTKLVTVLMPRGARLDESPIEALDAYLTVESVNQGSIYVKNQEGINNYGWIETVVTWDNVNDPSILLSKAQKYLTEGQFEDVTLEISAVDLHYLNPNIGSINLLDYVRCISEPHGMDKLFPVSKLVIPLDNPSSMTLTLGVKAKSLVSSMRRMNEEIKEKIDSLPTKQSVLTEAKENATQLITSATSGYVTIIQSDDGAQEILITDEADYKRAQKVWRWNVNGLGYSNTGYNGTYGLAMTMDGKIVADFITAGTMLADRIKGGELTLGGQANQNGVLHVKNSEGKVVGKWDKDGITLPPGTTISWADVTGTEDVANIDDIPTDVSELNNDSGYIDSTVATQITKDTITSTYIKGLNLEVGNEIKMGNDAVISWINLPSDVASNGDIPTNTSDLNNDSGYIDAAASTQITKNTVNTTYINALEGVVARQVDVSSPYVSSPSKLVAHTDDYSYRTEVYPSTYSAVLKKYGGVEEQWMCLNINKSWLATPIRIGELGLDDNFYFSVEPNKYYYPFANKPINSYIANTLYVDVDPIPVSDERLKDNIVHLSNEECFNLIKDLKPVEYVLKKNPEVYHHGFIAQESLDCKTDNWTLPRITNETGYYGIPYGELVSDLVGAINYLNSKITKLEEEIEKLKQ